VFRLYDIRTGQAEEIRPAPGGLLRLQLCTAAGQRPAHVGDLRVLLVADLIRRNAEHRHNLTSWLTTCSPDGAGPDQAGTRTGTGNASYDDAFRADAATMNLRPAEQTASGLEPADAAGSGEITVGACRVRTGQVLFAGREIETSQVPVRLPDLAGRGLDPLALRLAFLSGSYRDPADLTWDALSNADQLLRQWRERVAQWAESPSRPVDAQVTGQVAAAFDDDLDTAAALQALAGLEQDPEAPPGSKLETFLRADQLLALDLPRDIGRLPSARNNSPS
jgi:hypothetical protein